MDRQQLDDVKPSSLSQMIGQVSVIQQCKVALDACQMDNRRFEHSALVGPPGLGKSQLASVIAQELASDFIEVLGQSIRQPADLNTLLLAAEEKTIVHIDEAHELPKAMQTAIYLALDKRCLVLGGNHTVSLNDFTLLMSTTDEYGLLQPLRDRCRLVLRYEFYSIEDLREILRQRIRALGWIVDPTVLSAIAERARGTPRIALRLLQSCWRYCRSEGREAIASNDLFRACELEQLQGALGLGPVEQRYLQIISLGSTRLNVISSMLGLPTRTVSQVIEPFLIRSSLITKDDYGKRLLTPQGRTYLTAQNAV